MSLNKSASRKGPGVIWPVFLLIIGIAAGVGAVSSLFGIFRTSGTTFTGPGSVTLTIQEPGEYMLWHKYVAVYEGEFTSVGRILPAGVVISVKRVPDGRKVPISLSMNTSVNMPQEKRISVATFGVDEPGQYRITVDGLDERRLFYVGANNFLTQTLKAVGYGLLCGFSIFTAFVLVLVIVVTKANDRKERKAAGINRS